MDVKDVHKKKKVGTKKTTVGTLSSGGSTESL
jgi:hypothetical protein